MIYSNVGIVSLSIVIPNKQEGLKRAPIFSCGITSLIASKLQKRHLFSILPSIFICSYIRVPLKNVMKQITVRRYLLHQIQPQHLPQHFKILNSGFDILNSHCFCRNGIFKSFRVNDLHGLMLKLIKVNSVVKIRM
jgi:hypothetical protein